MLKKLHGDAHAKGFHLLDEQLLKAVHDVFESECKEFRKIHPEVKSDKRETKAEKIAKKVQVITSEVVEDEGKNEEEEQSNEEEEKEEKIHKGKGEYKYEINEMFENNLQKTKRMMKKRFTKVKNEE